MTGRQPGSEFLTAELDRFAIADDLIDRDRWKKQRVTEPKIAMAAVSKQRRVACTRDEFRAALLFQLRQTARMIQVCVAIQENLHVLDFETELGHVSLNLGRGFGKSAVQKERALAVS